jgi:hypothetical protein
MRELLEDQDKLREDQLRLIDSVQSMQKTDEQVLQAQAEQQKALSNRMNNVTSKMSDVEAMAASAAYLARAMPTATEITVDNPEGEGEGEGEEEVEEIEEVEEENAGEENSEEPPEEIEEIEVIEEVENNSENNAAATAPPAAAQAGGARIQKRRKSRKRVKKGASRKSV